MGVDLSTPMNFTLTAEGRLVVSGEGEQASAVNKWLEENTALADNLTAQLKKQNVDSSAVSLRLGATGNVQVTVNNSDLTDAQEALNKSSLGQTLYLSLIHILL